MITVYLVGPLFTEADQVQRRKEGERRDHGCRGSDGKLCRYRDLCAAGQR